MEQNEVTIKQIADQCGVSKSTAVRKFKEMDLPVITRGGKGTVYLGPEAASALAHALIKVRVPEVPDDLVSEVIDLPRDFTARDYTPRDFTSTLDTTVVEDMPTSLPRHIEPPSPVNDAIVEMYKEQIRSLSRTNDVLREQINQLNTIVEVMQSQHESTVAVLSDQIDHLNAQLAMIQKEKDQIRDDLAMSRALEGFHFPWQRDRIVSRYLLPSSSQSEVMDESDSE